MNKLAKKDPPQQQPDDGVKEGDPDLVYFSADGDISKVRKLLSVEGQDPNRVKNNEGVGPLHAAAAGGHLAVAQLLVVYGADINQRTAYGRTPLFMAAKNGKESLVR